MSNNMGGGGGGSSSVKVGGGFQYTSEGRTYTLQWKNGKVYNVSDLANVPTALKTSKTATQIVTSMRERGYDVTVLSPKQMQQRTEKRNADRSARANIDYELGVGVPWGNKNNRRAARRGRLATRAARRR